MYKLSKNPFTQDIDTVINLEKMCAIPFDPANSDYQAYLKWLDGYELQEGGWVKTSEGNTPEPAEGAE
jgi:hypothetical protein